VISSGRIRLEGSGGSGEVEVEVPPGYYRARLSGFDFDAAANWSNDDTGYPADHHRFELWPVSETRSLTELKRWVGYADRMERFSGVIPEHSPSPVATSAGGLG
jgi:hypothetical protein